jgi:hypothetical protein
MMVAFDVDCGELIPGHHFIARGRGFSANLKRTSPRDRLLGDFNAANQSIWVPEQGFTIEKTATWTLAAPP